MPSAFKRYTKWRFIAFSRIGVTLLSATAATHLWIEKVEFVPESIKPARSGSGT
jgi:hypothetical protein